MSDIPDFLLEELGEQIFDNDRNIQLNEDVEQITKWWIQEEASPELLPFQTDIVQDLNEMVERQQGFIDESRNSVEEASSALLYQMDIDRVKYILSRYLKARLRKIEHQILHIVQDVNLMKRLSAEEYRFARTYGDLVNKHAEDMILNHLPESFQSLTDDSHGERPGEEPDVDRFVFCRVKRDLGRVQVDDSTEAARNDAATQTFSEGDVHVLKYRVIRPLVLGKDVELI